MTACPVCDSKTIEPFIDLGNVPLFCNVQWPTRDAALRSQTAPLALVACRRCGYVFNDRYDPELLAYSPGYDNTQHFSSTFKRYAESLVERLVTTHGIRDADVVDIGCGRGDLLHMICTAGGNRGFGFDPSFKGQIDSDIGSAVTISKEYFTERQGHSLKPALVCCRHVLEHVPDPVAFLQTMRQAIDAGQKPVLYLEVPNGEHLLHSLSLWDYIYEHVSYFSEKSLEIALRRSGFELLAMRRDFGNQFLCAEVRPAANNSTDIDDALGSQTEIDVVAAAGRMNAKLAKWRNWAAQMSHEHRRAAVWGAGSKGVMFLNLLADAAGDQIAYAIDQNPHKHGQYVSGSAQQVVAPTHLVDDPVDEIILMNEIYLAEVQQKLDQIEVRAKLIPA